MSPTTTAPLSRYLDRAARAPFEWGRFDCLLWLADWAMENGWRDPATRWRGHYSSALGCRRIVDREGGMTAIAGRGLEGVGIAPLGTRPARAGDVGVGVKGATDWGFHPIGLIRTGVGWASLTYGGGLHIGPAQILAAWSI